VKSEVKSEVIEMPAKKRKHGNSDGDEDEISDHMNDERLQRMKKPKKRA
jgi:hypothetical protein